MACSPLYGPEPKPDRISTLASMRLYFGGLRWFARMGGSTCVNWIPIARGEQNSGQEEDLSDYADPPPGFPALALADYERERQDGDSGDPARNEDLDSRSCSH